MLSLTNWTRKAPSAHVRREAAQGAQRPRDWRSRFGYDNVHVPGTDSKRAYILILKARVKTNQT